MSVASVKAIALRKLGLTLNNIHYILFVLGLYEMIDLYAYKNTPQRLITEAFLMLCALSALICNRHTIKKTGLQIAGPQILFHPWPQIE